MSEKLLTTRQAAELLALHPHTLEQYRWKGVGPKFLKLGHQVRYRESDLWARVGKPRSNTRDGATA
jgi:Helix-turn-helix domain